MRILTLLGLCLSITTAQAQTTLYSESFEGASTFTLNTTDAASSISVWNTWVINNSYAGGDGDVICLGFPFTYTIIDTPTQPVGITTPGGSYLHTASVEGIADGITNCSFGAADGFCITADNTFSRMTADVSTAGYADVEFKFWWLCQGGSTFYGQVYYSTNAGASWTNAGGQFNLQATWTEQTVTLPAFGNQATLRFGFRFVNSVGFDALDPGFGIDDVRIIGATAAPNTITTSTIAPTAYCQGAQLSVPYTVTGAYNAGNIFSAELSDASGSFAAPTVIGTLNATTSGTITCTIPALTPVGIGYRVRVVSSDPVTTGSTNTADITVSSAPYAGADDAVVICKNTGVYDLAQFIPGASACGAWAAPGGGTFSGQFNSATDNAGAYTYTTNCAGGCPQDNATITIGLQDPANAGNDNSAARCSTDPPGSLLSYVSGGDLTGIFFLSGTPTTGSFLGTPGVYPLVYVVYGTAPCVNDTSNITITVNAAANAGTSASLTVCANDAPVALITYLGASAQASGTWTGPSGGAVSGVLDPAVGPSGLYTYTVTGTAPCANAQAFVAVVIDPCSGIEEGTAAANTMLWLGQQGADHLFRTNTTIASLEVIDAAGRIVNTVVGPFAPGIVRVALGDLALGMHVVRITGSTNTVVRIIHQ